MRLAVWYSNPRIGSSIWNRRIPDWIVRVGMDVTALYCRYSLLSRFSGGTRGRRNRVKGQRVSSIGWVILTFAMIAAYRLLCAPKIR